MSQTPPPESLTFDLDSVLDEARQTAALSDFGDEDFLEPLRVLLASLEREASLHAAGRLGQRQRIVDLLVNRLRVEEHLKRVPEVLAERIERPVVIVGLPRTGTTMLHRTLARDPRFYALFWYEVRIPAPYPGWDFESPDPRIARAEAEVQAMLEANPDLMAMHPFEATAPDEDIMLLEHSFYSTTPEAFAYLPSYGDWLEKHDNTPGYLYLEKLLKFLQWQKKRTGQRAELWLLKAPHHMHHMDVLLEVFPDARIVQTHRNPLETMPSIASFTHALWKLACDDADPVVVGRHWIRKYARGLYHTMEVREQYPDRFLDIRYQDTVAQPFEVIRTVYDFLGIEFDERAKAAMEAWRKENPRDKRPPHRYETEAFGYTEEGLKELFRRYSERHIT